MSRVFLTVLDAVGPTPSTTTTSPDIPRERLRRSLFSSKNSLVYPISPPPILSTEPQINADACCARTGQNVILTMGHPRGVTTCFRYPVASIQVCDSLRGEHSPRRSHRAKYRKVWSYNEIIPTHQKGGGAGSFRADPVFGHAVFGGLHERRHE